MGKPQFSYFHDRASANEKTVDFDSPSQEIPWVEFNRPQIVTKGSSVTPRRRPGVIVHGSHEVITIEFGPFDPDVEPEFFRQVVAFTSYALGGGIFAFTWDSDRKGTTVLLDATDHDDDTLHVSGSVDFLAGERVVIIDADDDSLRATGVIESIPGADTEHIVLEEECGFLFRAGSVVRHWEYFPQCMLFDTKSPLRENKANDEPGWMWKGSFETVVVPA